MKLWDIVLTSFWYSLKNLENYKSSICRRKKTDRSKSTISRLEIPGKQATRVCGSQTNNCVEAVAPHKHSHHRSTNTFKSLQVSKYPEYRLACSKPPCQTLLNGMLSASFVAHLLHALPNAAIFPDTMVKRAVDEERLLVEPLHQSNVTMKPNRRKVKPSGG